jgi:hypothetical protein
MFVGTLYCVIFGYRRESVKFLIHGLGRLNLMHIIKLLRINFFFHLLQLNHCLLFNMFSNTCITTIKRWRQCVTFTDNKQLFQISFINCVYFLYDLWFLPVLILYPPTWRINVSITGNSAQP